MAKANDNFLSCLILLLKTVLFATTMAAITFSSTVSTQQLELLGLWILTLLRGVGLDPIGLRYGKLASSLTTIMALTKSMALVDVNKLHLTAAVATSSPSILDPLSLTAPATSKLTLTTTTIMTLWAIVVILDLLYAQLAGLESIGVQLREQEYSRSIITESRGRVTKRYSRWTRVVVVVTVSASCVGATVCTVIMQADTGDRWWLVGWTAADGLLACILAVVIDHFQTNRGDELFVHGGGMLPLYCYYTLVLVGEYERPMRSLRLVQVTAILLASNLFLCEITHTTSLPTSRASARARACGLCTCFGQPVYWFAEAVRAVFLFVKRFVVQIVLQEILLQERLLAFLVASLGTFLLTALFNPWFTAHLAFQPSVQQAACPLLTASDTVVASFLQFTDQEQVRAVYMGSPLQDTFVQLRLKLKSLMQRSYRLFQMGCHGIAYTDVPAHDLVALTACVPFAVATATLVLAVFPQIKRRTQSFTFWNFYFLATLLLAAGTLLLPDAHLSVWLLVTNVHYTRTLSANGRTAVYLLGTIGALCLLLMMRYVLMESRSGCAARVYLREHTQNDHGQYDLVAQTPAQRQQRVRLRTARRVLGCVAAPVRACTDIVFAPSFLLFLAAMALFAVAWNTGDGQLFRRVTLKKVNATATLPACMVTTTRDSIEQAESTLAKHLSKKLLLIIWIMRFCVQIVDDVVPGWLRDALNVAQKGLSDLLSLLQTVLEKAVEPAIAFLLAQMQHIIGGVAFDVIGSYNELGSLFNRLQTYFDFDVLDTVMQLDMDAYTHPSIALPSLPSWHVSPLNMTVHFNMMRLPSFATPSPVLAVLCQLMLVPVLLVVVHLLTRLIPLLRVVTHTAGMCAFSGLACVALYAVKVQHTLEQYQYTLDVGLGDAAYIYAAALATLSSAGLASLLETREQSQSKRVRAMQLA